jgi:hypothetical protein
MAYKLVNIVFDIEFPDGMDEDEPPAPFPPPGVPDTKSTPIGEIKKLIRDGAAAENFDCEIIFNDTLTQIGGSGADMYVELAVQ